MRTFSHGVSPSRDELKHVMALKADEQLYAILHARSGDYTPQAIEVAREEFQQRNLDASALSCPAEAVEVKRRKIKHLWWIWPPISDEISARNAVKNGFWACVLIAALNAVFGVYALASHSSVAGYDAGVLVDGALFALVAWRLWRNSRTWAVIGLVLMALNIVDKLRNARGTFSVVTIVLILAIVSATRGVFALHRYRIQNETVSS
jgi:hypothetical protein